MKKKEREKKEVKQILIIDINDLPEGNILLYTQLL